MYIYDVSSYTLIMFLSKVLNEYSFNHFERIFGIFVSALLITTNTIYGHVISHLYISGSIIDRVPISTVLGVKSSICYGRSWQSGDVGDLPFMAHLFIIMVIR